MGHIWWQRAVQLADLVMGYSKADRTQSARSRRREHRAQRAGAAIAEKATCSLLKLAGMSAVEAAADFTANNRGDFGTQQFDGAHYFVVGHGADAQHEQEAVVAEDLVLVKDLLDDLIGCADEIGAVEGAGSDELLFGHGRPTALTADLVHDLGEVGEGFFDCLPGIIGDEAVGIDAQAQLGAVVTSMFGGAVVEIGQGGELFRTAANDGNGQVQAQRAGAGEGFRRAANGYPDRQRVLERPWVYTLASQRGAVFAGPGHVFRLAQLEQQFQFFDKEFVVIAQIVAEEREGFDEGAAPSHDFRAALGDEIKGGEALEDAHGIVGTEHGDGAAEADVFGARRRGSEDDRGRGGNEIRPVVLTQGEDIEANLIGELDGF